MRDIFDIIENRKTHHIKIEGEVSEYSLAYDLETTYSFINELVDIILENPEHVETKKFYVQENNASNIVSNYGIYANSYDPAYESVEFDIDVYVDNFLYRKIEHLEDFIDYYTKGSIVYQLTRTLDDFTIDEQEEYMSRGLDNESARINIAWEDVVSSLSRPVPAYEWNYEMDGDWQIGSHPLLERDLDADGDAVYASSFSLGNVSESALSDLQRRRIEYNLNEEISYNENNLFRGGRE